MCAFVAGDNTKKRGRGEERERVYLSFNKNYVQ